MKKERKIMMIVGIAGIVLVGVMFFSQFMLSVFQGQYCIVEGNTCVVDFAKDPVPSLPTVLYPVASYYDATIDNNFFSDYDIDYNKSTCSAQVGCRATGSGCPGIYPGQGATADTGCTVIETPYGPAFSLDDKALKPEEPCTSGGVSHVGHCPCHPLCWRQTTSYTITYNFINIVPCGGSDTSCGFSPNCENCDSKDGYDDYRFCYKPPEEQFQDVYQYYLDWFCESDKDGCNYGEVLTKVEECGTAGCVDGKCLAQSQACENSDTSCGIYPNCENCNSNDGYVGSNFCYDNDVYRVYEDWFCESNFDGCNYDENYIKVEECGTLGCISGACKKESISWMRYGISIKVITEISPTVEVKYIRKLYYDNELVEEEPEFSQIVNVGEDTMLEQTLVSYALHDQHPDWVSTFTIGKHKIKFHFSGTVYAGSLSKDFTHENEYCIERTGDGFILC